MARLYKLEVQRDGVQINLYYHDDGSLELADADSGMPIDYLNAKLRIMELLFDWCLKYKISSIECSVVE
jgi:hypothetical protein